MAGLGELYDGLGVAAADRIVREKNVLLVLPDSKFDVKPVCGALQVSPWEVSVTWPKAQVTLGQEVTELKPRFVLQVGCQLDESFPSVDDVASIGKSIRKQVTPVLADLFVNLHHHDEYSIKDGLGTVKQLCKVLNAQRRSFCCVTNHGSVGGWIKQYNACQKAGVKAVFAMETYVNNVRDVKSVDHEVARKSCHLVLIANNMEGFYNIIRIHNDAQLNGFYYVPRTTWDACKRWGKGISATSACLGGEIPRLLLTGQKDKAREVYETYAAAFDEFLIELQLIEYEGQRVGNRALIEFAREVGAPLILGVDSHYLEPQGADSHDLIMCIRQKKTLNDKTGKDDVWNFDVRNLYYRNADQVLDLFKNGYVGRDGKQYAPFCDDVFTKEVLWEAMRNGRRIAVGAEDIKLDSSVKLPKLYPDGEDRLRAMARAALDKKIPDALPIYRERLEHELGIITKLGWADYFLMVELLVSEAVSRFGDFAVGLGRGSAGGSLVCYVLGITGIDPLRYGLLFERFIDVSRGNVFACEFKA